MTKIVILEGHATSGKSTMQKKLYEYLRSQNKTILLIDEYTVTKNLHFQETRNIEDALNQLILVSESFDLDYDYIILDRFHFSQIASLNSDLQEFKIIEDLLLKYDTKLIYLNYLEETIVSRIRNSLRFRKGIGYENYFNKMIANSNSIDEENQKIINHYMSRIKSFQKSLKKTRLDFLELDVTNIINSEDFDKILLKAITFIDN